jgi:hypothetical protein
MTKLEPKTSVAKAGDQSRLLNTLASAFAADPAVRWMYPDAQQYRSHFPAFVRAFGGRAIARHGLLHRGPFGRGALAAAGRRPG